MITAKKLESIVKTGAKHALYSRDGTWYHHLEHFPGVLFDLNGFIVFKSQPEYFNSPYLHHGQHLNIYNGISTIPGYQKFTKEERGMIDLFDDSKIVIDEIEAWVIFLKNAKAYESKKEIFVSPSERSRYQIVSTKRDVVKVERLDIVNSSETIGRDKFRTCISRINKRDFPIKKSSIYEHVVEETTIVELLPMLDWSEDGKEIVYAGYLEKLEETSIKSEAKNDDITKKSQIAIKVRRGQKKLREKLLLVYERKCAVTGYNVEAVLHACHIRDFAVSGNNISTNAILLRSDIHDLFDANLLAIEPISKKIVVHRSLENSEYYKLNGQTVRNRNDGKEIDDEELKFRWNFFKQ